MTIGYFHIGLGADVDRPAAPADHWPKFKRPLPIRDANEFFGITIAKAERLYSPNNTKFPTAITDPAQTDIAVPDQEPVSGESRVTKGRKKRIGVAAVLCPLLITPLITVPFNFKHLLLVGITSLQRELHVRCFFHHQTRLRYPECCIARSCCAAPVGRGRRLFSQAKK